jgi:hypothetical protein
MLLKDGMFNVGAANALLGIDAQQLVAPRLEAGALCCVGRRSHAVAYKQPQKLHEQERLVGDAEPDASDQGILDN